MNEQNAGYLKDNLKYMGFGENLYVELESRMQQQPPSFSLKTEANFLKDKVEATLHFRKSDQTGMYFFNRYDATLIKGHDKDHPLNQTFYVNRGQGITLKEAYNLLEGRAVHKVLANNEGRKYNAWVQLKFDEKDQNGNYKVKQFHDNYGFNVSEAVSKLPVKELLTEEHKTALIKSLEKGNIQSVTFEKGGLSEKAFIEANPQFKTIDVYDGNMKKMHSEALAEKFGITAEPKQNANHMKTESKNEAVDKKDDIRTDLKKNSRKELKNDKPGVQSLLPKKRVNSKKGLSIAK